MPGETDGRTPPVHELRLYRFVCPECGTSDAELGYLIAEHDLYCVVCLNEDERHVILQRWHEPDGGG